MIAPSTNIGKAAFAAAVATTVIGLLVFIGWSFQVDFLKSVLPGSVTMNPATALAMILAGISLSLSIQAQGRNARISQPWFVWTARGCALGVALIGLLRLAAMVSGWDLGVDQWMFPLQVANQLPLPSRIAPNVAFNFLLIGGALLFVERTGRCVCLWVELAALVAGCGALLAIMGYLFNNRSFYSIGPFVPMALNTSVAFIALVAGILLSHADRGLLARIAGDGIGAPVARRLLPAAILVPAIFGFFTLKGERAGLYEMEFAVALFAMANMLVFTAFVSWSVIVLFRIDIQRKLAEQSLRESEERFSSAFAQAPIGVALVSPSGQWLKVNRVLCDLVGYSEADLLSRNFRDITHPEDVAASLENVRRLISGEVRSMRMEKRYVHGQGHLVTVLLNSSLVRDDQGRPRYFINQILDITERQRAEESLQRAQALLRMAGRLSRLGAWSVELPDFKQTWSDEVCAILGIPVGSAPLTIDQAIDFYAPEFRETVTRGFGDCVRDGTPFDLELQIISAQGQRVWVRSIGEAERDATGVIRRVQGAFQDISERKQIEEALQRQKTELRVLFDLMPAMIWFKDTENGILRINQRVAEAVGKPIAEIEGRPSLEIYPEDAARFYADDLEVIRSGNPKLGYVEMMRGPIGQELWMQTDKVPYRGKDGTVIGIVVMAQDITERKQAQVQLENVHKQLLEASRRAGMAEIATNVLHNVGNVLNSVNISTGLIIESVKKSRPSSLARVVVLLREHEHDLGAFLTHDPRGKHVPALLAQLSEHLLAAQEAVVGELDSLRRNVEHIKEIVAMQQNYATFGGVKEIVNVVNLVKDSLRMNGSASPHDVEIVREFEQVPLMNVEKHKILQILINLLRNARLACIESARADKVLTVRVIHGDGQVRISVIDNGIGIPPENLTRIFNHGFTTRKEGHGFGLHSGALAAREMGGSLTVHSDGPGQGAAFTLELPCETLSSNGGSTTEGDQNE